MHEKLKRAKGDIALSLGSIAVSLFFLVESNRIKDGKRVMISGKVFPRIWAVAIIVCALVVLYFAIRNYLAVPKEIKEQDKMTPAQKKGMLRVFEAFLVLLGAAIFYKRLGFIVVGMISMFLLFIIIEEPEKRNYKLFAAFSIICPIIVFFAFYFLFSNLLPMGVLKSFLYNFL